MRKPAGPALVLLLVLLVTATTPSCQKKPPVAPGFAPPGATATGASEARVTLFGTLDLGLRFLEPETRARYIREVAGQDEDPFRPTDPGVEEPFLVFLFTIENRGQSPVLISPSFGAMVDRKGRMNLPPFDAREIQELMAAVPAFTPELGRRFHDATVNVNPGQRMSRLLVFPALPRKVEMVEVVFPSLMSGNLSADAHFPFTVTWTPISAF